MKHDPRFERFEVIPLTGALGAEIRGVALSPDADSAVLLSTLRVWFAERGATSSAAAKLHVHRNTVRYRLRRVEELTGRDLAEPAGIAELHLALEATRIPRG